MMKSFKLYFFIFTTIFAPLATMAEVPKWEILKEKSSITFSATQNNSPVTGEFKTFSGEINFDTAQLSVSNVSIVVDIDSVTTSYPEIAKTLKSPPWFDAKTYPKGTFKATSFNKVGDNSYEAKGTLTLRNKSSMITLPFELNALSAPTAVAKGEVTIQRSTFGVGGGEWASTDNVKDEVKISFTLTATKK
jgi:polyisoprenoid-binding protein YceI